MNVLHGRKALQKWLQSHRQQIGGTPIVLIESQASDQNHLLPSVEESCRWFRHVLQQQLNLRTVVYHSRYAFPTLADVQQASELAERVGAETVAAAGSGSAMDLAKAMEDMDQMILLPGTVGAELAAGTSHALLVNPREETVLAKPRTRKGTVALAEPKSSTTAEAAFASLTFALDNIRQKKEYNDPTLLEDTLRVLETGTPLEGLLLRAGQTARYGLDDDNDTPRSVPIALLASLLPADFSAYPSIGFLASLAPSLSDGECPSQILAVAPQAVTTSSVDALVAMVNENQSVWGCADVPNSILRQILKNHAIG